MHLEGGMSYIKITGSVFSLGEGLLIWAKIGRATFEYFSQNILGNRGSGLSVSLKSPANLVGPICCFLCLWVRDFEMGGRRRPEICL